MKNLKKRAAIIIACLTLPIGLLGCGTRIPASTQSQTPAPSQTAPATLAPSPALTPSPTLAPSPALTPSPTPAPAPAETTTGDFDKNAKLQNLFNYDCHKAFNDKELNVIDKDGVKIHEISYDSYDATINRGKVTAYMVVPEGDGPFPAVIYMHWLGNISGNKKEFLTEAVEMAKKGVVCFLIDGYFPWQQTPDGSDKDRASIIYQVIELRRAIDYVSGQPFADSKKMAYVGHDYGAMFGSILSGIDNRIGAYDLITGMGNFKDWFVTYWVKNAGSDYIKSISELDPMNFLSNASPAKLFFQFANSDTYIGKDVADAFYQSASDPKEEKFYDDIHRMNNDQAKADRIKWLSDYLGLK